MSYHTGNNNNNNRSSQQRSTPASTPPVPTPPVPTPPVPTPPVPTPPVPTPAQRSGNANPSGRPSGLREVVDLPDRGGFEPRACPDEAPDGNGKPLTDDGSVWENPPPCSTIFVWDYEDEVWVRQEGEGKPNDAIDGGGTGGSGLTEEQAREWALYREYLKWFTDNIIKILSNNHPDFWYGGDDDMDVESDWLQDFIEYQDEWWGFEDPNWQNGEPPYWSIPTKPSGYDPDLLEQWERENDSVATRLTVPDEEVSQRAAAAGLGHGNRPNNPPGRSSNNTPSQRSNVRTYENGNRIPGNFPTAYQNSLNKAGPAGQKCGNCKLFNQNNAYCSAWKATANKNYWCQSYVPYVNITKNGAAVSSSDGVFSLRDSNNKLVTYQKGISVVYNGELYEVTKNVFGQLPDKSSSFVKITNIDDNDNVIDGGSFGKTPSVTRTPVTRTPVRRSSGGSSSSSSSGGGGY